MWERVSLNTNQNLEQSSFFQSGQLLVIDIDLSDINQLKKSQRSMPSVIPCAAQIR